MAGRLDAAGDAATGAGLRAGVPPLVPARRTRLRRNASLIWPRGSLFRAWTGRLNRQSRHDFP